jgi:hypothetical protein
VTETQGAIGRLPNRLIAGTARAGTTALHHYLGGHPDIFMCAPKEPRYFSGCAVSYPGNGPGDDRVLAMPSLAAYCSLFGAAGDAAIVGEASPENLYYHRQVIPMIRSVLGDPAIVIMLRDPVDRAYSSYLSRRRERLEPLTFEEALAAEDQRRRDGWSSGWYYSDYGFYADAVEHYRSAFTNVYIGFYEDLAANTAAEFQRILTFLGVDAAWCPATFPRFNVSGEPRLVGTDRLFAANRGGLQRILRRAGTLLFGERDWVALRERLRGRTVSKPPLRDRTRRELMERFRPDVLRLQAMLERDLSRWLA